MKPSLRKISEPDDPWRVRQFLREVFLLNERREHSWHVARWDYLQWHLIANCQVCPPLEQVISIWETPGGQIAAVLHPVDPDEAFIHIHPEFRSAAFEAQIITHALESFENRLPDGTRRLYVPVDEDDRLRKEVLAQLGFTGRGNLGFEHYRDLDDIPAVEVAPGYCVRSMGGSEDHPARNWASWQAFHPDEADENFDPDPSWIQNIQRAPLYRRDLDVVAATADGQIAAFCTLYYDDATRSGVTDLVGTATPHQRRGLGEAVVFEAMRRAREMGCTRVFAKATDTPADLFYSQVMPVRLISETWIKDYR